MKHFVPPLIGVAGALLLAAPAIAQPAPATQRPLHMPFPSSGQTLPARDENRPAPIELSSDQRAEIDEINDNLDAEIEDILGSDQAEKLQEALNTGEDVRGVVADLDLSDNQLNDLNQALESARQQIIDAINPDPSNQIQPPQRQPF